MIKFTDEQIKSMRDGYPPSEYDFEETITSLSYEVYELRECLKEAIREKCPFMRMSCKHGEPCDYECGTVKWRKALREKGETK